MVLVLFRSFVQTVSSVDRYMRDQGNLQLHLPTLAIYFGPSQSASRCLDAYNTVSLGELYIFQLDAFLRAPL